MVNQKTQSVYVSYSRRADYSFIQTLLAKFGTTTALQSLVAPESASASIGTLTEQTPDNRDLDQWALIYDENGLDAFGSISGFMEQLSEAQAVVILLSPGYFQSPYCLTELLLLYTKRADDLLPIVVFVDGYQPDSVNSAELAEYWDQQRQDQENNNEVAAAKRYSEFNRMLPAMLAWLLGSFDTQMQGWDTLLPVIVADNQQIAAEQVSEALENPIEPRFAHYSSSHKTVWIASQIETILARPAMKEWLSDLKVLCSRRSDTSHEFAAFLARPQTAEHLIQNLGHLINWLAHIKRDFQPSTLRRLLSADVKELLSYLLMTAVDDRRLHQLIHQLNRLQEQASHELLDENETALQMIVSAVACSPVRYRYTIDLGSDALQGDGQLELIERGCSTDNYYQWLESEENWLDAQRLLYQQMIARPRPQKTERALHGAMDAVLNQRQDFYLRFDKTHLDLCKNNDFRKHLGKRFPAIQHVISSDEARSTAEDYYLDGLNSGYLDQMIYTIYDSLHELAQ